MRCVTMPFHDTVFLVDRPAGELRHGAVCDDYAEPAAVGLPRYEWYHGDTPHHHCVSAELVSRYSGSGWSLFVWSLCGHFLLVL